MPRRQRHPAACIESQTVTVTSADSTGSAPGRSPWRALGLLVLAALALDFVFFTGLFGSDDTAYLLQAQNLLSGVHGVEPRLLSASRLGLLLPAAFGLWVARGEAETAALLFSVFHVLLLLFVYYIGAQLHGRRTGLLAAALTAFCPLLTVFAGCVLPDIPMAAFLAAAFAVVLPRGRGSEAAVPRLPWWLLSGLLMGSAYAVKEGALVFFAVLLAMAFSPQPGEARVQRVRRAVGLCAGLLLAVGVQALVLTVLYGTPSVLVKAVQYDPETVRSELARFGTYPMERGALALEKLRAQLGLFVPALLVALAIYPFLKRRSWALWAAGLWLIGYFTWGSMSLTTYLPGPIQARYYIPALPFALICLGACLVQAYDGLTAALGRQRFLARLGPLGWAPPALVVAGLLANSFAIARFSSGRLYYAPELSAVSEALDFALLNDQRQILLSPRLAFRSQPLFFGGKEPRIGDLPSRPVNSEEVQALLGKSGALCLFSDRDVAAYQDQPSAPGEAASMDLPSEVLQAITTGHGRVRTRQMGAFYPQSDRLDALLRWRNWHSGWSRRVEVEHAVYLYEVSMPAREPGFRPARVSVGGPARSLARSSP